MNKFLSTSYRGVTCSNCNNTIKPGYKYIKISTGGKYPEVLCDSCLDMLNCCIQHENETR
jgi:hypothetical protein